MDIEKLVERLKSAAGGPDGIKMCQQAATALSMLRAENEKMRAELEQVKAERDAESGIEHSADETGGGGKK